MTRLIEAISSGLFHWGQRVGASVPCILCRADCVMQAWEWQKSNVRQMRHIHYSGYGASWWRKRIAILEVRRVLLRGRKEQGQYVDPYYQEAHQHE